MIREPKVSRRVLVVGSMLVAVGFRGGVLAAQEYNMWSGCYDSVGGLTSFCPQATAPQSQAPRVGYDPCYLAQNAMRPCAAAQGQATKPVGVDPHVVGTWELALEGGLWVLEVRRDGTYSFHSEAGDGAASHAGTFSASNGHWSLIATTGYTDSGTYQLQGRNTWIATGRLGTGTWRSHAVKTASNKQ